MISILKRSLKRLAFINILFLNLLCSLCKKQKLVLPNNMIESQVSTCKEMCYETEGFIVKSIRQARQL